MNATAEPLLETIAAATSSESATAFRPPPPAWPLKRVLFALAGTVTLLSAALAAAVSPWFLLLTGFVGVNQWLYVAFGACPSSIVLRRALGLRSAIYRDCRQDTVA